MGSAAQTIHLRRLHSLQPEAAMQQSLYRATARVSGVMTRNAHCEGTVIVMPMAP